MLATFQMFSFLLAELSILFLIISFAVALLQTYIPEQKIQSALRGKKGYLLAAILGSVTPFCSCSTIPMLRGLLKAKVGFGPLLTFLFTSPLLNPIIIGLFAVTFGFKVTGVYVSIALIISLLAGFLLNMFGFSRFIISGEEKASCCSVKKSSEMKVEQFSAVCCSVKKPLSEFGKKARNASKDAITNFKSVWVYLLIGVSLGSVIYGFVPSEIIVTFASSENIFAVPVAAIVGIPLYVRAEMLIPLSTVLVGKGMSLGAVMALIIGGGGASLTEVILLKSMFKMPMIIAFVGVILFMAIFAGYFFQFIF